MNIAWVIFVIGLIPLGLAYYPLKAILEPWLFVLVAVLYLVSIRVVAEYLNKKFFSSSGSDNE
jgi:hypothetical protein